MQSQAKPFTMKSSYVVIFFIVSLISSAQKEKALAWINENSIKIEDTNPDSELSAFKKIAPKKFSDAKIFGFGESTHHGKEFFDIKAKFFKHLVKTQNVKTFIMEDSYVAEAGINEWISGGEGDVTTIANNFTIYPWRTKEVVKLLEWMRNYNLTQVKQEQIRFYGMDIQDVTGINLDIRRVVEKYKIPVNDDLLSMVDQCVEKKVVYDYDRKNDWADVQIPKLNKLMSILGNFKKNAENESADELNQAIRAISNLSKYTYYVQHHYSHDRDLKMYENVKWIVENEAENGKAFIWAHNEHVNNRGFGNYSKRKIYNLGRHLKENYKNNYYSVGFDFGTGSLRSYVVNEDKSTAWKVFNLEKPYPNTYAETLIKAKHDIYFVDMADALNSDAAKFFDKTTKQLSLGGPGYDLNNADNNTVKKRFSKAFDGLIFVKSITPANRNLSAN